MTDVSQLAADLRRTIYERPYIRRLDWLTLDEFLNEVEQITFTLGLM